MKRRTHGCGELRAADVGKDVTLSGWVQTWRDHGGVVFIDLRDRTGFTQVVFNTEPDKKIHEEARRLRCEYVISISGKVSKRPGGTENPKMPTGKIEIITKNFEVLNTSEPPPFEISDDVQVSEDVRFAHRYLDLRRPSMYKNLHIRHRVCKIMRDYFTEESFLEVETPILTKSTPEGARDYLVPSRLNPGKFYALPQSPQLFKQILMVAGLEKYFQITKCFRDEDLRADRQPEFTQLDLEMSFCVEDDIFSLSEELMRRLFKDILGINIKVPFERISYGDAISRYGTDKPDTRFGMEIIDISKILTKCKLKIFNQVLKSDGSILAITVKGGDAFSIKEMDELTTIARDLGAGGLAYFRVKEGGKVKAPIEKYFSGDEVGAVLKETKAASGDLILFMAGKTAVSREILGSLRLHLSRKLNLTKKDDFKFLWVVDFPLFKYNEEGKRWDSEHHPFTSPQAEDLNNLEKAPGKVKSRSYDLVVNGMEMGSGSIRIHGRDLQEKIFKIIGIEKEEAQMRFGFLLDAFKYGAPPHGGVAFGVDRLITLFTGSDTIRDVIAFPKTQKGTCPLTTAPSDISEQQLKELSLKVSR